ncbi:hypothetical protein HDU98_004712, partial [Podochytrium sp. JEL0797]
MFLCYFLETGNFADWFAMQDMDLQMLQQYAEAFQKQLLVVVSMFVSLLAVQLVGALYISRRRGGRRGSGAGYLKVGKNVDDSESGVVEVEEYVQAKAKGRVWWSGRWFKMCALAGVCYCFIGIRSGTGMARLSENFLVSPPLTFVWRDVRSLFREDYSQSGASDLKALDFQYNVTVYPATDEAKLENVVVMFRESLRADMLDFNATHDTHLASLLLNKSHIAEFDSIFSPFLNRLKHKSLFFPRTRTASAYTIKSFRSTLCGVYAAKGSHLEFIRQVYAPCLPHLLPNHTSRFYYPGRLDFDHFTETIQQVGFSSTYSIEDVGVTRDEWMNSFGVDDRRVMPNLSAWLTSQVDSKEPFVMGLLDNIGHHPFDVPEGNPIQRFARDDRINRYLNAVNNVDSFFEGVFAEFAKHKGLLEKTLFVIIGDHGMGLNDHGVVGTGEGGFEESFRVPM